MLNVDSISAGKVLRPQSVENLAEIIRVEQGAIVPLGGCTQTTFGNPLRRADCVIDLTGMNRITTYNPAELTIHVEAGATIGHIQNTLAENNQTLPLDPWNGPLATIGGIAAANAQGPLRATGSVRDWIIGMKVVHADGRVSKTGGRVVKNVTGYDLAKLYTGSLGTLAVIAEISLKVRPQYGRTVTLVADFDRLSNARVVLDEIRKGPLQPIACELAGPQHSVWVRFGEHTRAVDWQASQLPAAEWKRFEGREEEEAWTSFRERFNAMGPIVLRVAGLPAQIHDIIEKNQPSAWIAHALNGIVFMSLPMAEAIPRVRQDFPALIEKAPAEVRRDLGVFGIRGLERRLILQMKQAFDPGGRLNPGRHLDGEQ